MSIHDEIIEYLETDILDFGFFAQMVSGAGAYNDEMRRDVVFTHLESVLKDDRVAIGNAVDTGGYVAFISWRGTSDENLKRARSKVESLSNFERGFAFWLCLKKNVDKYEDEVTA
jgi:hypothetical protein